MRAKLLIAALAGALGVLGGWLIARQPAPPVAEVPQNAEPAPAPKLALAPPPRPARGERVIPFSEIVATGSCQPGMKNTLRWRQVGYEDRWGTLDKALGRTRTQHTFVVNAPTPAAAAHAAAVILEGHDALEEVPIDTEPGQNKFWAFVTLGTWTNAPSCEVVSVIATKDSLIVNYKPIRHAISMGGAFHHTFLIPLDKLQPGWYTLRLRRLEFGLEDDTRVVRIHIGSIRAFRQEVYKNWLNAQQP